MRMNVLVFKMILAQCRDSHVYVASHWSLLLPLNGAPQVRCVSQVYLTLTPIFFPRRGRNSVS